MMWEMSALLSAAKSISLSAWIENFACSVSYTEDHMHGSALDMLGSEHMPRRCGAD